MFETLLLPGFLLQPRVTYFEVIWQSSISSSEAAEQSSRTADGPAVWISVLQLQLQLQRGHSGPLLHLLRGDPAAASPTLTRIINYDTRYPKASLVRLGLTIRHNCRRACSVLYSYCFEDLHYLLQGDPAVVSTIQVSPITRPSYNFYEETMATSPID